MPSSFDDLLEHNRAFAETFALQGFDGVAKAGVAMVTCMDSRIDPLGMIGLVPGDAKILRNPGGRATERTLVALVLGVNLLGVKRIMLVQHTRCAMASKSERELLMDISEAAGVDASWLDLGAIEQQRLSVIEDVHRVRSHPLIGERAEVGGFLYDVDTGLLEQVA
ncbi:carbonic anhydrase [Agrococcus sp. TF02-05]|uniref:beta-class carbonic anhydrase n=1 Tax=Agrococcus sp. TF02-05 TaxID=2815211 RepID=UPI001AA15AC6|nr:carbonic anhydrase [Agrococcus sp. TF02-05]MBO1770263.1 carbonic anhydrase [Agrococcus sp. TF02-05]